MHSLDPRAVLRDVGPAVVYVSIERGGDKSLGTAFHVGGNWFVTAKHVVDGAKICRVGRQDITERTQVVEGGHCHRTTTWPSTCTENVDRICVHPDERIDVAMIHCPELEAPLVQLETRSDLVSQGEFLLQKIIVMGYPRIPFAKEPTLVASTAEIASVIEHYSVGRRHFIASGMARGGFSGGPALTLNYPTRTLGVVTQSLARNDEPAELGFTAILSSELVIEMIQNNGIRIPEVEATLGGIIIDNPPKNIFETLKAFHS